MGFTELGASAMNDIQLTPEVLVSRLGDYLVERKLITASNLQQALDYQATLPKDGQRPLIGQILVQMGFIERSGLDQAVTEQIIKLRARRSFNKHYSASRN
jgi:hypothetical protein